MQEKLLSIVIPTFNIEQYIVKNIESFKQVKENYYSLFELIIVNDGSTDSTLEVIEQLSSENQLPLRVITKENGGHGSTINVGIQEAQGKYFKVIDGDDWINVSAFESFLDKLEKIDADLIITNYTEQHVYKNESILITFNDKFIEDSVVNGIPNFRIPMHCVTYQTSILKENNIYLSEKTFYVDTEYTLLPLKFVKNYVYFNLDVYQYFLGRPDQSMNINVMKQKSDHHLKVTKRILDFYSEIIQDKALEPSVRESLNYLINKQIQLFVLKLQVDEIYDLFTYAEKRNYLWKYDKNKKTTNLLYINYKCHRVFDFLLNPLVRKQKEEWSELSAY